MSRADTLFRAIVVMGAAITSPACDKGQAPAPARPIENHAMAEPVDAGVDAAAKKPVDRVLIL